MNLDFDAAGVIGKRCFFGHQSVGANILEGVAHLKTLNPEISSLQIKEALSADQIEGPGIYHTKVGTNRDVPSKLSHFEELLIARGIGERVDVALLKLCYVDISEESDAESIFQRYASSVERIRAHLPQLVIVHSTIPLTVNGPGVRRKLRNWLRGDQPNINRFAYNQLLRSRFRNETVFDVALAECTHPNGSLVRYAYHSYEYETAFAAYISGAGHLNSAGARHVARAFLKTLA